MPSLSKKKEINKKEKCILFVFIKQVSKCSLRLLLLAHKATRTLPSINCVCCKLQKVIIPKRWERYEHRIYKYSLLRLAAWRIILDKRRLKNHVRRPKLIYCWVFTERRTQVIAAVKRPTYWPGRAPAFVIRDILILWVIYRQCWAYGEAQRPGWVNEFFSNYLIVGQHRQ